ncbi:hypothetical protein ACOMHN_049185 [Nucella lapillus]
MESSIEDSGQETDDIELGDAPSRDQAQDKDSGQETHVQLGDAPSRDQAQDKDSGQETHVQLGDAPSRDQAQDKDSGQETHVQLGDAPSRDQAQDKDSGQETHVQLGDAPSRDQAQDKDSGQETHVQLGDAPSRDQAQDNHGALGPAAKSPGHSSSTTLQEQAIKDILYNQLQDYKQPTVFPSKHRPSLGKGRFGRSKAATAAGVDSFRRCFLGTGSGPAQSPSVNRYSEASHTAAGRLSR